MSENSLTWPLPWNGKEHEISEKGRRVLLMGGSVFVGRAILRELLTRGFELTAITTGRTPADWAGVEHIACDRRSSGSLRAALEGRCFDAVIDVSSYESEDVELLAAALPGFDGPYVLISSAAVYDRTATTLPFREGSPSPGDSIWGAYGLGKAAAETSASVHHSNAYILRPPYIYGPGNNLMREAFFWARIDSGLRIFVPGTGETLVQMCHVDDLSRFACDIAEGGAFSPGHYNVGEPTFYTFEQLIDMHADVKGMNAITHQVHDPSISARSYFPFRHNHLILDVSRSHEVGASFRDLRSGLLDTLSQTDTAILSLTTVEQEFHQSLT